MESFFISFNDQAGPVQFSLHEKTIRKMFSIVTATFNKKSIGLLVKKNIETFQLIVSIKYHIVYSFLIMTMT